MGVSRFWWDIIGDVWGLVRNNVGKNFVFFQFFSCFARLLIIRWRLKANSVFSTVRPVLLGCSRFIGRRNRR